MNRRHFALSALAVLALLGGCAAMQPAPDYRAIIASPDRSDADREVDKRRNPELLLAFTGARPGMKVLDMGTGGGYSTELMSRAVGPSGVVYGQDSKESVERLKGRFEERAAKPVMKNVIRSVRNYDDPLPPGVGNLDLITFFFFYHDTAYMTVDRAKMNKALFDALKSGGVLIVADHSAQPGAGASVVRTLHRIEESLLRREVEAAGFRFVGEGGFLRNPADPRDAPVFKPKQPVDEFVLKFVKP